MKKMLLTSLLATALLSGCSKSSDIPQDCLDVIDITIEVAEKAGQPLPKDHDEMIKELETQWSTMNDDQKEKATQNCKQAAKMMEMMKGG